jgi:Mg-chelatase subunit ChlD
MNHRVFQSQFASPTDSLPEDCVCCDVLVADISGSMAGTGFARGLSKIELVRDASLEFLSIKREHRPQDYVAIVAYQYTATSVCSLQPVDEGYDALEEAIRSLPDMTGGGTRLSTGLRIAKKTVRTLGLVAEAWDACDLAVRVLAYSDGRDHSVPKGVALSQKLKERGVLIETFGVAKDRSKVDESFLREVATTDQNGLCHYKFLGDAETLAETFKGLATGMLVVED